MDIIQINKFTRSRDVDLARNNCYNSQKISKVDSLRLIIYACRKLYGVRNTAKILHGIGVDKIDLSL